MVCGWSQSSLKRVLVSNLTPEAFDAVCDEAEVAILFEASPGFKLTPGPKGFVQVVLTVAILFEASPGFQLRGGNRHGAGGDLSQSSSKRVLVSNKHKEKTPTSKLRRCRNPL